MTDDDVVEESDLEQFADLREFVRDLDIFRTWGRVSARVVVDRDDRDRSEAIGLADMLTVPR